MYALGNELGVPMIAEGVERPEERQALVALGADLAQGNAFGVPAPGFSSPAF
jgi:EAL domain-containing protein (putative c-di-GMP-specific phosphodiesterase class I)